MGLPSFMNKLTVHGYVILFLSVLVLVGAFQQGFAAALVQVIIALFAAVILDLLITYIRKKQWIVPKSALISGLFIGSIPAVGTKWYMVVLAAAVAILSKHIIRFNNRHLFNPAAIGLLVVAVFFGVPMLWWGSSSVILVLLFGLFAAWRMGRLRVVISYFIAHSVFMVFHAYFSSLDIMQHLLLVNSFFLLFMVTEPKTSPVGKKPQMIYGIVLAALAVGFLIWLPLFDHSILALAIGNLLLPFLIKLK